MKKFLAMVLAGAMALGLAACGGEGGASSSKYDFQPTSTWKPSTTINVVVPAGAGGNTDLSARVFTQYVKEITGCDAIVTNTSGSAGSLAAQSVLDAAADGCTVLYGHNLVNVASVAGVTNYDYTAFKLGPTFAKDPAQQLYVSAEKYDSLDAFISAAKAAPGELTVATEVGAYTYYEVLAFQKIAGIELKVVDAGSNSDKITAMLSGSVDLMPGAYINCKDYLTSGKFFCLGAPTENRYDIIKDIPTLKEQGIDLVYPDCDFSFYFHPDTDDEAIKWYEELVDYMLQQDAVKTGVAGVDMEPYYLNAADSAANDGNYLSIFQEYAALVK